MHGSRTIGGVAALTLLATLALAPTASATYPDRNGLLAFQAQTDAGVQIFTVRPNGKDLRQLTHVDGDAGLPDWSPDGHRLVITVNDCWISLIDADGSNLVTLPAAPGGEPGVDFCDGDASFTPDGARLVYDHYDAALDAESVWSMRLDGSNRVEISSAGGADPNVSPDGTRVSFKGPSGALDSVRMDGTGFRQVSPSIDVTYKHDWAPDGRHIVVSDNAEPGPDDAVNVVVMRPDGTGFHAITHYGPGLWANVGGYSPDGQWIVFRLTSGDVATLYRMRPDGSDLHAILPQSTTFVPRFIDWGPAAH
jgi:Tol biopolymer transport system component